MKKKDPCPETEWNDEVDNGRMDILIIIIMMMTIANANVWYWILMDENMDRKPDY